MIRVTAGVLAMGNIRLKGDTDKSHVEDSAAVEVVEGIPFVRDSPEGCFFLIDNILVASSHKQS